MLPTTQINESEESFKVLDLNTDRLAILVVGGHVYLVHHTLSLEFRVEIAQELKVCISKLISVRSRVHGGHVAQVICRRVVVDLLSW
jgi:hypothetical protein